MSVQAVPPQVALYTRAGCHLCDVVKQQLAELQRESPFELSVFDIDEDPTLQRLFNDEVPVVFIHGRKAFKYAIDRAEFLKMLHAGPAGRGA